MALIDNYAVHALIEDSSIYWNGARHWIESGFFSVFDSSSYLPETERVPLYHMFLIPFNWIFGDVFLPPLLAQTVINSFTCVIISMLGDMINKKTGLFAGLFAALSFNLILHSSLILSETIFLFLMTSMLFFAARYLNRRRLLDASLVGLFCGLAIMTRTLVLLMPLAMAVAAPFISRYYRERWTSGFVAALVMLLFAALPLAPIIHRNLSQFDTPQLTSQTGVFMLNWVVGISKSLESGKGFDEVSEELNEQLEAKILKKFGKGAVLSPFELSNQSLELAFEELKIIPLSSIAKGWVYGAINNLASPAVALDPRVRKLNINSFYNSQGTNIFDRAIDFLSNNSSTYIFFLLGGVIVSILGIFLQMFGLGALLRYHVWIALFGTLFIMYFLLVSGPIGSAKYRIPIEPVLILFQAFAATKIYNTLKHKLF